MRVFILRECLLRRPVSGEVLMERLTLIDQALHKVTTSGLPSLHMPGVTILDPRHAPARFTKVFGKR